MKLLVTGSRGFVGGSVGRFAAASGHEVAGVDLTEQPDLDWPGEHHRADVASVDLSELIAATRPDVVLHAAGSAAVGSSFADPVADFRASVGTWVNVLDGARRSGVRPLLVLPSSAAVYGEPSSLPVAEDAPLRPLSPYGFHKRAAEWTGREFADCYGLDVLVVRLFSVYGPRQRRLLVHELCSQALGDGEEVVVQGTGRETRDFLHVDDIAAALLALAAVPPAGCTVVNMASGIETTVSEVAALAAELCAQGAPKEVRCLGQARPGDPLHWRADIGRLSSRIAFVPRTLRDGMAACLGSWRDDAGSARGGDPA